jgi:A/G-specific adenine glycosylase
MREPAFPPEARVAILDWYDASGRSFPFRGLRDPYAILVSEVMAQQTQISRVPAHWAAFIARFPTVQRLADAPTADVLRAWRGLGYNRRALNLQRAARTMVERHDGRVPSEVAELQRLPGIGPYTARAIAALAFGLPVGPMDTNVRRVLGRMTGADGAVLQGVADAAVPPDRTADWTHALMDLGATICRPARPRCPDCPAGPWCRSLLNGEPRSRAARGVAEPAFEATSRWLRGRILDRLRDVRDDGWSAVAGPIGGHDDAAVNAALATMAAEGLIELDGARARLAR